MLVDLSTSKQTEMFYTPKEEGLWYPRQQDIARQISMIGYPVDLSEIEVVGLAAERDDSGCIVRIFSSADSDTIISGASDVIKWLGTPDNRLTFISDNGFLDSLGKWLGVEFIVELEDASAWGRQAAIGSLRIREVGGSFSILKGGRGIRKVYSIRPFYHMYKSYTGEEDCIEILHDATRLLDTLKLYELPITSWYSGAGITQGWLGNCRPQDLSQVPDGVLEYATGSYHTNWVTAFQRGFFEKAWDYDITSAYPARAAELITCHPSFGAWVNSSSRVPGAVYGFCVAEITIRESSPIIFRHNYADYNPKYGARRKSLDGIGSWVGYITIDEIDFIESRGIGEVNILDGWWFVVDVGCSSMRPFSYVLREMFSLRSQEGDRDKFLSNLIKLAGVGLQGKFMSTFNLWSNRVAGFMYNPVYASMITARTRIKLAEFCLDHQDSLLHVAVDGCTLTKLVKTSNEIGEVRLNSSLEGENCIVARDGEYWMPSRSSVFQPAILQRCSGEAFYYRSVNSGRYTRGDAQSPHQLDITLEDIGKPRTKLPKISLDNILRYSHRYFLDTPQVSGDLLEKQYPLSRPKIIGGHYA